MSLLLAEHQAGKLRISILYGLWFDPTGNRTQVNRFSSTRSIHSTSDRFKFFRILATVPGAGALSAEQMKKLTYGPYLPTTKLPPQIKPTQPENDVHSGPLFRLLLELRNEIAQVKFFSKFSIANQ